MGKSKLVRTPGFAMPMQVRNQVQQEEMANPAPSEALAPDESLPSQTDVNMVNDQANSAPQPPSVADQMMQALNDMKAAGYSPDQYKLSKSGIIPPVPPQLMAKVAPLVLQSAAEMKQQGDARVGKLDDLYNQYQATMPDVNGPNYAGLLALADTFGGGKTSFAKNYKSPKEKAQEQMLKQMDLQKAILKEQTGLSDKAIDDMIKYMGLNNSSNMAESAMVKGEGTSTRFTQNEINDILKEMRAGVKDKIITPMSDTIEQVNNVSGLISTGKWQDITAARSQLARLLGQKGVLTDKDVATVIPSNIATNTASFLNWLTSDPSEDVPPAVKKQLEKLVERAKENIRNRYVDELKQQATGFSTTDIYGLMKPGKPGHSMFREQENQINRIFKGGGKKQLGAEELKKLWQDFKNSPAPKSEGQ